MNKYATNGLYAELSQYETPFADTQQGRAFTEVQSNEDAVPGFPQNFETPFSRTYETWESRGQVSRQSEEFVELLGELDDTEFSRSLYELASEIEDSWLSKISNEAAMGESYMPFTTRNARQFIQPLQNELETAIDKVGTHFSGNNLAEYSETEIESFFSELGSRTAFSPAQEQFFGSVLGKIKSVVKKGVDLAKKGVSAVGKIMPVGIVLDRIKKLVKPLLERVLKFAIGKLPKNLQPHAQTLAKKFLNLETPFTFESNGAEHSTGEIDAIQTEFDNYLAQLVFSPGEPGTEGLLMEYEASEDSPERNYSYEAYAGNSPSLDLARQQLINELKELKDGESPGPAIERFLPVAFMAIKMAVSIIGRQRVVNFLAGLLAKLVGKYVPQNVAQPLAAKIVDVGMASIGFETKEMNSPDLAYEAIANTIEETARTLADLNETELQDNEALTMHLVEAFESAAANNFPSEYIKPEFRKTEKNGLWVLKPRNAAKPFYKKYTGIFTISISPQVAATVTSFRKLPLADFLRDKLGLNPTKPIQAKLHLYETLAGTKLSKISKFEDLPGLNASQPYSWTQFHPLTRQAASLLIKEPGLFKKVDGKFLSRRHQTTVGQRFYYLEISGAKLKLISKGSGQQFQQDGRARVSSAVPNSGDAQAMLNFIKSEIKFNYYFSEESAMALVEKINKNDFIGAAQAIRQSVQKVLNGILLKNVSNKVKIIHESIPEMYLERMGGGSEEFSMQDVAGKIAGLGIGREILKKIFEKLTEKLSEVAHKTVAEFFKSRAAEFKQALAQPKDGVTIKITWRNVPGMSVIRAAVNAVANNRPPATLGDLSIPNIGTPEITVVADKQFD